MSNRVMDSRGERAIGLFLDKYFYPKLVSMGRVKSVERIYDASLQKKGIDIVVSGNIKVDEKTQLYYINKPLDTFIFEIDYWKTESGSIIDGWFISKTNETDIYLLLWINKARTSMINRLVSEDFIEVEACILSKKKVKEYIQRQGLTDGRLKEISKQMRKDAKKYWDISDECHLSFSQQLEEKPVNLVVKKRVLEELCEGMYLITKEKAELIKVVSNKI